MTRPMIVLPRTQAPIAILQLRPTAMMEEATQQKLSGLALYLWRGFSLALDDIAGHSPTSQFETAQASAIQ